MMAHLNKANDKHRLALSWLACENIKKMQHQLTILAKADSNEQTFEMFLYLNPEHGVDDFAQCSSSSGLKG